jgi:pimeloyl-ACP methyl ester carboxylesterase
MSGPIGATLLVLSHSLATNLELWDGVLPMLENDFRVIRYDARGHGGTVPSGTDCTMVALQGDVIALLDHLGIQRAHFAGLSLGGMAGIGLGLDHPDRLLEFVVCDAGAQTSPASRASWDDRIAHVGTLGVDGLVEPTLERWFSGAFRSDRDTMNWMRTMMRSTSADGYICCARGAGAQSEAPPGRDESARPLSDWRPGRRRSAPRGARDAHSNGRITVLNDYRYRTHVCRGTARRRRRCNCQFPQSAVGQIGLTGKCAQAGQHVAQSPEAGGSANRLIVVRLARLRPCPAPSLLHYTSRR